MQKDLFTSRHAQFVRDHFGLSEDAFFDVCRSGGAALDELLDKLTWAECDAAEEYEETGDYTEDGECAIELIDIICGPYDGNDINIS